MTLSLLFFCRTVRWHLNRSCTTTSPSLPPSRTLLHLLEMWVQLFIQLFSLYFEPSVWSYSIQLGSRRESKRNRQTFFLWLLCLCSRLFNNLLKKKLACINMHNVLCLIWMVYHSKAIPFIDWISGLVGTASQGPGGLCWQCSIDIAPCKILLCSFLRRYAKWVLTLPVRRKRSVSVVNCQS